MLGLLIPLRADELGISIAAIGLIVAARSIAETLLAMPLSLVMSRIGARNAFVLSAAGSAVVAAACTLADGFWSLLLLNAAIGAGRSLGWVASQTYISSQGRPEHRARDTGRFSFISNAGQMVTPLMVGASATAFGYRMTFLVVAAYCLAFALIGLMLPSRGDVGEGGRAGLGAAVELLRLPRLQVAMLLTFVRLWVPSIWTPFFPLFLVAAGFSAQLAGAVISSAAVAATAVNLATGRLSRYASPERLCTIALGVAVVGLMLSPHLLSVPGVFLPAVLVGIGNGLSLPLLIVLVSEASPPSQRGLALATRNAVNAFSSTLAPLGTAPLVAVLGATGAFTVAGGAAALLLMGVPLLQRRAVRAAAGTPAAPGP
jgi:DHA1 family inner membrane transport protein